MNNGSSGHGKTWTAFLSLAAQETDECVVWPFHCHPRGGHGRVWVPKPASRQANVHRLALEMRTPPPLKTAVAAHGPCHNPACMNYRHLYWASQARNIADTLRDGTRNWGARNGQARLAEDDVRNIRRMRSEGESLDAIALRFDVSTATVSLIARRRTWKWLT